MTTSSRRLRALALIIAAALIAAACGSSPPETLAMRDETIENRQENTRLRIATTDPAGLLVGLAAWERSHPTVTVEIDVRTSGDLLRLLFTEDEDLLPDVVTLSPKTRTAAVSNPTLFLDLDSIIDADLLAVQLPDLVEAGRATGGELIGVPLSTDAIGLAVRTDVLDDHLDPVSGADTWCQLLATADAFSAESKVAFLGDPTEIARAQFAQSRTTYTDRFGGIIDEDLAELEAVWDLTMASLGHHPLHGDPCPNHDDVGRISRNFTFGDSLWATAASADGFAASLVSYRDLGELAAAAPDTAGAWTILPAPGAIGASDGLVHLAVPASAEHPDLAIDLIATLASPQVQQLSFDEGSPTLPAMAAFYDDLTLRSELDEFFGDRAVEPFATAVLSRPSDTDPSPEREVVIDLILSGIRDVANDARSPQDAWDEIIEQLE